MLSPLLEQLAKPLREAPRKLAERIALRLRKAGMADGLLQKVEIAGPGFINLYVNWEEWAKRKFALPQCSGEKIIVEHTSVNPNKSGHTSWKCVIAVKHLHACSD